jgi:hypothetical protein
MESNLMNAYISAYEIACDQLIKMDPSNICLNSNSLYNPTKNLLYVKYLGEDYSIDFSSGRIFKNNIEENITTTIKVLILHYLINSKITPLSGKLISFKEIPGGGAIYYDTFHKRAIKPLVKTFGNNFDLFFKAGKNLYGSIDKFGNASITLNIFPLVPVTYVLWQGDDEFPPSGTILFDNSISNYLPGEDIVLAASFGVYALMEQGRKIV